VSTLDLAAFTVDAVHSRLGEAAWQALGRNETTPARRATASGDALDTWIRLFLLHDSVAARAVPEVAEWLALGVVEHDGDTGQVVALVEVRPYGDDWNDWWVVCDRTPGFDGHHEPLRPDFVLGVSEASSSLARLTHRQRVDRVLDLGTGCGVQSLHASTQARTVVATDINPRALELAALTASLSDVSVDLRLGSFYEPVAGERFDLITTNPPFVVSPPDGERLVYRESTLDLDGVVRHVVQGAADHLTPNGWCQVLAAWCEVEGESWRDRLRGWIEPTGLDAWVVCREVIDVPTYTEIWLADAGGTGASDHVERYDRWLSWFEEQQVTAMCFGWINVRRADRREPVVRLEHFTAPVDDPFGPTLLAWADAVDALEGGDPLDQHWRVAEGVVQETAGSLGAEDPSAIFIRQLRGMGRRRQVDTVEAALVSSCDGDLSAGQILDAIAHLLDLDATEVRETYRETVAELAAEGFLRP
jgi:methylase of polypeptide subunit release factors